MTEVKRGTRKTGDRVCHHPREVKRRQEAAARKIISDNQSPTERILELDRILGPGIGAVRERARNNTKLNRNTEILETGAPVENTSLAQNPELAAIHEKITGEVTVLPKKTPAPHLKPFPFIKAQGEGVQSTAFPTADPAFLSPPVGTPGAEKRERKAARKAKQARQDR